MKSQEMLTESEINAAEDLRYAAQIRVDGPAMERLFGDELVYVHSNGAVDSKSSYIESMKSGRVRYRSMERYDTRIRIFGVLGVLTGRARFEVTVDGAESVVRLRFHSIWEKRATGLYFVSWQATLAP